VRKVVPLLLAFALPLLAQRTIPPPPSFDDGAVTLSPQLITIPVGATFTATAAAKYPPVGLPFTIGSDGPAVATADGVISQGEVSIPLIIKGVAPGQAFINYSVSNFGHGGSGGRIGLVTVVPCVPAAVIAGPLDQTSASGRRVVLTVQAAGSEPYAYDWFAQEIGESSPHLLASHVATIITEPLTGSTTFWATVTNPCGFAVSARATVAVPLPRGRSVRH
jgi:hypothetical protein